MSIYIYTYMYVYVCMPACIYACPEGNKPATPPIFSMPAKSGDVQRDDDVTSGEARNAIAPLVWPLLLTLCAWFVSA